ncbi:MAG: aspartate aminotransferase family protein [Armatimonadetes bacterium]|nr:aspartate aminotransferase family protein [Armatimonadota bacterium]
MNNNLDVECLIESANQHLWQNYFAEKETQKRPSVLIRGEGIYVYDSEGKRYLDTFAALLTTLCGHGRPEVTEAVHRQMEKLAFFPGGYDFIMEPTVKLAKKLAEITPGNLSVTFFVNDGSEATEAALKMARQYHWARGEKSRHKVLFRRYSYHGATLGALSVTGLAGFREPFEPLMPGSVSVMPTRCYRCEMGMRPETCDLACLRSLEAVVQWESPSSIAAIIMDPIPGSNTGFPVPPDGYLQGVRELCDKHGILLIFDEIQVGFGRTGKWFCCENWEVVPDILVLAKGFGGGYVPIGAAVATTEVAEAFRVTGGFRHVHTFSGHAVACAAALTNVEIIEKENLVQRSAELGIYLRRRLEELYKHPIVGDVRGMGTLWAVEMVANRETREHLSPEGRAGAYVSERCRDAGMILRNNADLLVMAPPLIMTNEQADGMVGILDEAIRQAVEYLEL